MQNNFVMNPLIRCCIENCKWCFFRLIGRCKLFLNISVCNFFQIWYPECGVEDCQVACITSVEFCNLSFNYSWVFTIRHADRHMHCRRNTASEKLRFYFLFFSITSSIQDNRQHLTFISHQSFQLPRRIRKLSSCVTEYFTDLSPILVL